MSDIELKETILLKPKLSFAARSNIEEARASICDVKAISPCNKLSE